MRNFVLLTALSSLVCGCATPSMQKAESAYLDTSAHAHALAPQAGARVGAAAEDSQVRTDTGMWLPTRAVASEVKPAARTAADDLLLRNVQISRSFTSVSEVAERVTAMSGVPIDVNVSAEALLASAARTPQLLDYSGSMAGLLDMVATRFNLNWKVSEGHIVFFLTDTRVFTLKAIPGGSTLKTMITTSSTAGVAGGAGSSNESTVNADALSVWTAMESAIKAMLSPAGKVAVSPALGTIAVTDTPEVLDRVGKLVDEHNRSLSRQVAVNVQVLSVTLNNSDEYGINWNAVYQNLSGNFGMNLTNAFLATAGAPGVTLQIPSTAPGRSYQRWAGSEALITALSTQGKVSVVTSASAVTLNNQPVPIQVGRRTAYLASSSTTTSSVSGGTTTALTPGTLTTGFSMTVLPHILEDNQVLLQYSMDISSLIHMYTVTSGDASIQVPDVETRNFLQRVSIRSGDTLVLAGFEQAENSVDKSGAGHPENTVLGGGIRGKEGKNIVVVLVRPVVVEGR